MAPIDEVAISLGEDEISEEPLHYWGYAGKPTIGIPCGVQEIDTTRTTNYDNYVTCPHCLIVMLADANHAASRDHEKRKGRWVR